MCLKFMPYIDAIRVRRHAHYRDDGEHAKRVVLLDVDEAESGVEQELDVFRQADLELVEGGDVPAQGLEARHLRGAEEVLALAGDEREDALEAEQARADLAERLAPPADAAEDAAQRQVASTRGLAGIAGDAPCPHVEVEDPGRERVEIGAHLLQGVGEAVHQFLHQKEEDLGAGLASAVTVADALLDLLEGAQFVEPDGDEPVPGQDEAERGQLRIHLVEGDHRCGERKTVLEPAQAARILDLAQSLSRWDAQAGGGLDMLRFLGTRIVEVDPDRMARHAAAIGCAGMLDRALRSLKADHGVIVIRLSATGEQNMLRKRGMTRRPRLDSQGA